MPEAGSQTATYDITPHIPNPGEWALVHKGELAGLYRSFESAWSEAYIRFGGRRCMVRQVSVFPMALTVSAENLQSTKSRLLAPMQKWTRFFARQLFAAGQAS